MIRSFSIVFRPLLALAAVLTLFALSGVGGTSADSGARTFKYLLGTGPLCAHGPDECPDIAMAHNGDTIDIAGSGMLGIHPDSISGGGTFTHHTAAGPVSGTWAANRLLGFHEFGCTPDNRCGGHVLMNVTLSVGGSPVHNAILQFDCVIRKPPAGAQEGVRLAIQGALNFNHKVSGGTVLILQ